MSVRNNCFVVKAEYTNGIKHQELKDLLKIGSRLGTPLEKKPTFDYVWANIDGQDIINKVIFYAAGSSVPSRTFNLKEKNYIPLQTWYRMMRPVWEYPEFIEELEEKERVRDIVKRFEEAAKLHGCRQLQAASGLIDENGAYETGKALRILRKELYEELGV